MLDKKIFDANSQINRQNDRIYAASKNDAKNGTSSNEEIFYQSNGVP